MGMLLQSLQALGILCLPSTPHLASSLSSCSIAKPERPSGISPVVYEVVKPRCLTYVIFVVDDGHRNDLTSQVGHGF